MKFQFSFQIARSSALDLVPFQYNGVFEDYPYGYRIKAHLLDLAESAPL